MCKGVEEKRGASFCRRVLSEGVSFSSSFGATRGSTSCELCGLQASLYCKADDAYLCGKCDKLVHEANFLALRHIRCFLCNSCQNLTRRSSHRVESLKLETIVLEFPSLIENGDERASLSRTTRSCASPVDYPPMLMADSSKEEFLQLIKRLTLKISNIIDSHSIGAVAGLAIAIFFTWRLLRSPGEPQPRQRKRQTATSSNPGVSSHSNASVVPSGIGSPSGDSRAQNVVDDLFQPVKPTLGQIVRQKLNEGRKVTCRLLGVILEETSPEELQKQVTVKSTVLEVLLEITKFCDLYLMERVLDDESEVLFCSTEIGRSSFVRQLEPDWHIDSNPEIISQLARFIKYQLHVSLFRTERTAANVFSAPSLEQFFGST